MRGLDSSRRRRSFRLARVVPELGTTTTRSLSLALSLSLARRAPPPAAAAPAAPPGRFVSLPPSCRIALIHWAACCAL